MFESLVSLIPASLKNTSGAVFNSGRNAFSSGTKLYLLGLNPGGDPAKHGHETVQSHSDMVAGMPADWSTWTDVSLDGRKPGAAPLQARIRHMIEKAGLNPHKVPSSNLIFKRTATASDLGSDMEPLANLCWPFHQKVIDDLGVKVVVCFGQQTGTWVRKKLKANQFSGVFQEQNNRGYKSEAFASDGGLAVVTVTHPSRFDWRNPASDPSPLVVDMLRRFH